MLESHQHDSYLQTLVDNILAGLGEPSLQTSEQERLGRAIEANVRWSMHQILETPDGDKAVKAGAKLVGAVYEIASGHVRLLS